MEKVNISPFLKWAGGKTQMLPHINEALPANFERLDRYVEPFVGAGAVFFNFISNDYFKEYIINDINSKLINLYVVMRDNCEELIEELTQMKEEYFSKEELEGKEEYFYALREEFNLHESSNVRTAAIFIFLNKTCFNGLYRENSKGNFNVPFGKHKTPGIFVEEDMRAISKVLNTKNQAGEFKVKILNKTFDELLEYIDKNTFVYFDPPYRPVTAGGFNSYNKSSFNDDSQIRLRDFYNAANEKGATLMLSNSDPKVLDENDNFFDELYKDYNIARVLARRNINSKGTGRGAITELLITNY
ncbi:MAG: DNA adenine methylase [Clostridium sp.]|nr:DNA adenine methylase [Clostridium sp.]MDU7082928.1 DNA adenine methylase [Clostridium sp.]